VTCTNINTFYHRFRWFKQVDLHIFKHNVSICLNIFLENLNLLTVVG